MIISRTPVRISFGGGGTDMRPFYETTPGAIIGSTINKYIYLAVNDIIDDNITVSYWKTENVDSTSKIEHSIVRKALETMGLTKSLHVASISDIPPGTGLGSSGSFTVGLLNALYAYKSKFASKERLAREACRLEIDMLEAPIGKQDQYLTSYGGLLFIQFNPDESVFVEPIICPRQIKQELSDNLMLFYTGQSRQAGSILTSQYRVAKQASKFKILSKIKDTAFEMARVLSSGKDLREFGALLNEEWSCKKSLVEGISNDIIDNYYERAIKAGATGGKITGAGGGGFILLYCEKDKQVKVREALNELKELNFCLESQGSNILTAS